MTDTTDPALTGPTTIDAENGTIIFSPDDISSNSAILQTVSFQISFSEAPHLNIFESIEFTASFILGSIEWDEQESTYPTAKAYAFGDI